MKSKISLIVFIFSLFVFFCGGYEEIHYYVKCFFIADTAFTIEGEVFTNDKLTNKLQFDRIKGTIDSDNNWEIEGVKTTGNRFSLAVNATANGITLSKDIITQKTDFEFRNKSLSDIDYFTLVFYIDGRRARGAIEPEFNTVYYYIYIPQAIDISSIDNYSGTDKFGKTTDSYYHYDLNFSQPGWYKIYYSKNKKIGNKASYSSGANTKIRAPM
jgi:hypothetical protein